MTRPTPSASYRPHSISRVEPNITRARRSRAARIAPNREVLLSVPAIVQGTRSLININMRLLHRIKVQERQLRAVTINLHQVLLFLACWGRACALQIPVVTPGTGATLSKTFCTTLRTSVTTTKTITIVKRELEPVRSW